MKPVLRSSVAISPATLDSPRLEEVVQALHHVESLMAINEDALIEPGQLGGMSVMLEHAENVLSEMRAALPSMRRHPRPPTAGSTAWPDLNRALAS